MRTNPNEAKPTFGQKCFPLSQTSDLQQILNEMKNSLPVHEDELMKAIN